MDSIRRNPLSILPFLVLLALVVSGCAPAATTTPETIEVTRIVAGTPETIVITSTPEPEEEPEAETLTVSNWGGHSGETRVDVFQESFERETGIDVIDIGGSMDYGKVKVMVDAGQPEWDIAITAISLLYTVGEEYFEEIDYSDPVFDTVAEKNPYAVPEYLGCEGIIYQTDLWEAGEGPQNWADFWDTEKFPGKRALGADGGVPWFTLESAVMAAGTSLSDVYPIDFDLAFEKLDELRETGDLVIWESTAEAAQMLANKDVAMARLSISPIWELVTSGQLAVTYNQAICWNESLHIIKGANYDAAMKYIIYEMDPVRQAAFAQEARYGPSNLAAFEYIPDDIEALLPGSPAMEADLLIEDYQWYGDYYEEMAEEWNLWVLE